MTADNTTTDIDALAEILGTATTLEINNTQVDVSALKLGEIIKISAALKVLKKYFKAGKDEPPQSYGDIALDILIGENAGDVLSALAVMIRQPRSFVDDLGIDELVDILTAVLVNNISVFQKKVLPAIVSFSEKITAQAQTA